MDPMPRKPKGKTDTKTIIMWVLLAVGASFAFFAFAAAATGAGFTIWNSTRIEQVHTSNKDCLPSRYQNNECKVGILRKTEANPHHEYCTVENIRQGVDCEDACLVGHGECDGEGTCSGQCAFDCPYDNSANCPAINFAPNIFSFTECLWGGCTTFAFGGGPLGLCGSEKSMQTCRDMIAGDAHEGCLSVSQLCDEGIVFSCVFTADCHHVDDFDAISPPEPPMVRSAEGAAPAAAKSTFNHKSILEKVKARSARQTV